MSYSRARSVKILLFLMSFVLVDWGIESAELRPRLLTAAIDSVSLATGIGSRLLETVLVAGIAYTLLQIILVLTGSLRFLTGEPRRQFRAPEELTHEHGAADE